MSERAPRVLLGVTGGIAAYKAPEIVRGLVGAGAEVQVVLTRGAEAFTTELALATVSKRPVRKTLLDAGEEGSVGHIDLADWPDAVVIAPATAHVLARAATGLADDLLTTILLATRAPVLWAPAMNTNMWRHPATVENLARLRARGDAFVGPDRGELACGWIGEGRMIEPHVVVDAALELAGDRSSVHAWAGRRVIVTAGPTRAYLDPVRFLTNASTGAMGFAIAQSASRLGADVVLVAGPVERPTPAGVRRVDVETAEQMLAAVDRELAAAPADLVAMVAAVADLAPAQPRASKLAKDDLLRAAGSGAWTRGVDVLATLTERHRGRAFFLGFAAETVEGDEALAERGAIKMRAKGCQAIFVNRVAAEGVGFASPTNAGVLLLARDGNVPTAISSGPPIAKVVLARWLLDQLRPELPTR
jgi:phosphopantothenoylcysteine decarboxylase/phosphopantothenate--cysteine ligase